MFGGNLTRSRVPLELTSIDELLRHLCVSEAELQKIWWYRSRMYSEFNISKKAGKSRLISAPDRRLKMIQRALAQLLDGMYQRRNAVHGFVADRSVMTNARSHMRSKFVLNLDIENFFPTISENRVVGVLKALGVIEDVARIVARLCCNNGVLPQGAPTSPVLSNMICFRLDKDLHGVAKASHCIYTRYADDITLSSYQPPVALFAGGVPPTGNFSTELLAPVLVEAFAHNGFKLNAHKAHYGDRNSRRIVTGLKINEGLNVDRRFIRNVRSALYSIETLGIETAQAKFKSEYGGKCGVANHLRGKISWIKSVKGQSDPVFRGIAARFNKLFPAEPIKVQPTRTEMRDRAVWVLEHTHGDWAQGSAFFLEGVGLVTAAHCIQDAVGQEIDLYHPSRPSNIFKVKVRAHHAVRDLALLDHSIPSTEYFELQLSARTHAVGDYLIAVGYPGFAAGDNINVRSGQISSFSVKSTVPLIEVTQKLTQGMSGGPVLDIDGRVAGVIHKGGPDEGRDFAVNTDALMAWLSELVTAVGAPVS